MTRILCTVLAQGAQKLQLQVQTNIRFTKENGDIKIRWLVTFECLELEQSYIHHLKALMCGINASRGKSMLAGLQCATPL